MFEESFGTNVTKDEHHMISILLADDHPLIREALRNVLDKQADFKVVGEAGDGIEAVELAIELNPDVVIMDIGMPKLNGLEATRQIKTKCPNIEILVLTVHEEKDHIFGILEAGATGYLTKRIFGEEVIHAIRGVAAGETVLDKLVAEELIKHAQRFVTRPVLLDTGEKLTVRELEMMKLVARGMSNKEIAKTLGLSVPTVKTYLGNIFSKVGVSSRWQAVIMGLQTGFITSSDLKESEASECHAEQNHT